jgi:NodT family efflux transporter outer membrane factor (OMF) lipoprotein
MFSKNIISLRRPFLYLLVPVLFLTSCKMLQPYKRPDIVAEDKLFRDLSIGDTANIADIPWKSFFTDTHLQKLIDEALINNSDLKIALARISKAEANLTQSKLAFIPSVNANASGTFQNKNSDGSGVSEAYNLYGSMSWEADIWGKLRSTKRASLDLFLESDAYKRAVQTQLIADVATGYYTLMAYDAQLQITEKTLGVRASDVETMKLLKESDVVTGADLVLSQANKFSIEVTIPDIRQNIYTAENGLSVLLGRTPGLIERDSLDGQQISYDIKTGIPASLLANRPDVMEAEYQFRYSFDLTNVARSYFYPSLTISANGGFSETDLSRLFNLNTIFWNLTGGLVQPIFNQGINDQRLKIAKANQEEYLAVFKQTLLNAGKEVANAMHEYQTASDKMTLRSNQIKYLGKSVDYTMELLKYTSNTNYTDVLTSEERLLSAQLGSINDKLQQLQALVELYRSLGGGWK